MKKIKPLTSNTLYVQLLSISLSHLASNNVTSQRSANDASLIQVHYSKKKINPIFCSRFSDNESDKHMFNSSCSMIRINFVMQRSVNIKNRKMF
jgi:hypothetical protein